MTRKYVLPLLAAALLVFSIYQVVSGQQSPPPALPPVTPAQSPFGCTVAGAGIVEPETENISIGTALSGVVLEVYVPVDRVGQQVQAGDPLFQVDDRQLKAQRKVQEANLAAAQAQLAKLEAQPRPEEVPPSEAAVRTAQANRDMQLDLAERSRTLYFARAGKEEEYRQNTLAAEAAQHQLEQARTQLALLKAGAWKPDKEIARASVEQARALLEQTRTDLERSLVRAPVDGVVLQVNVRPGEYVGTPPGQALVMLGNLHRLHVRVDIDEHDIPRFNPGAPAEAAPRGDPAQKYVLRFVRVEPYVIPKKSLTGDNTERVDTRVLQAIYAVVTTDRPLYVGQQVDVFIDLSGSVSTCP
jgi:multidrug resistance efflux pump